MSDAPSLLACLLLLAPAGSSAATPEWTIEVPSQMLKTVEVERVPAIVKARAAQRNRRSTSLRRPRPSPAPARRSAFVTDPQTWQKLIERGKRSPLIETITLGGKDYRYHVLDTSLPVAGQVCARGTLVDNTLYVYDGLPQSPGTELYPVRLVAECITDFGAPDALSVDADVDGRILNTDYLRSPSTASSHPTFDPADRSAENTRQRAFLKGLVELFLSLP